MICLMHEGKPYGHLKVGEKVILPSNLASITGATLEEVEGWLGELIETGVCSVDDDGCIFSRRMIRDEELRQTRAAGGSKGGNPALLGKKEVEGRLTSEVKQNTTPSSSSASSSSSADNTPPDGDMSATPPAKSGRAASPKLSAQDLITQGVDKDVAEGFLLLRKTRRSPVTQLVVDQIAKEAATVGKTLSQALATCVARGWQGYKAEWDTGTTAQPQQPASPGYKPFIPSSQRGQS